jgi:hypothetical protein
METPAIFWTLAGKKQEVQVRKLPQGQPAENAATRDATMYPQALDWCVAFTAKRRRLGIDLWPFHRVLFVMRPRFARKIAMADASRACIRHHRIRRRERQNVIRDEIIHS